MRLSVSILLRLVGFIDPSICHPLSSPFYSSIRRIVVLPVRIHGTSCISFPLLPYPVCFCHHHPWLVVIHHCLLLLFLQSLSRGALSLSHLHLMSYRFMALLFLICSFPHSSCIFFTAYAVFLDDILAIYVILTVGLLSVLPFYNHVP